MHDLLRPSRQGNCLLLLQAMVPLGGCVQATPLLHALRVGFPELPVVVATRGLGRQVLQHNPDVSAAFELRDPQTDLLRSGQNLQKHLRARSLEPAWTVVDLGNPRTRIALLHTFFVPGKLIGFSLAGQLQHRSLQRDPKISYLSNELRIVEALGKIPIHTEPIVYASSLVIQRMRDLLHTINPKKRPISIFATEGSGGQPSQWSPDRMRALLRAGVHAGLLPVLVGTPAQAPGIAALRIGLEHDTVSVAGNTSVPELAALLALSDYAVSIDTGTMHVARASAVPLLVLAPTYQDPIEWLPLGLPHVIVLRGAGTQPAPPGYMLDEIGTSEAVAALHTLLARYPPSDVSREARLARIRSEIEHLN